MKIKKSPCLKVLEHFFDKKFLKYASTAYISSVRGTASSLLHEAAHWVRVSNGDPWPKAEAALREDNNTRLWKRGKNYEEEVWAFAIQRYISNKIGGCMDKDGYRETAEEALYVSTRRFVGDIRKLESSYPEEIKKYGDEVLAWLPLR